MKDELNTEDKLVKLFERLATESGTFKDLMAIINGREGYKMSKIINEFAQTRKKIINEARSLF